MPARASAMTRSASVARFHSSCSAALPSGSGPAADQASHVPRECGQDDGRDYVGNRVVIRHLTKTTTTTATSKRRQS